MKYSKILLIGLLLLTLLIPFVSLAYAAKTPGYVGVKEGQTYVWTTEFDAGPLEDYYEAIGDTKEEAEIDAIDDMEYLDWEEEVTEWKLTIHDIRKESEEDVVDPWDSLSDEYEFVKYVYTLKEYDGDVGWWRTMESYETSKIWESDEELWAKKWFYFDTGIESDSERVEADTPALIVAKDLDWDQVARERLDKFKYSSLQEELYVDEVEIQYFLSDKEVGLYTEYNPSLTWPEFEKDLDTFESISKYNDDGVLYYYEFTYDGDIIAKFELKGIFGPYFIENWWWMSIVAGAIVVGVIIIIIIIIKKRK